MAGKTETVTVNVKSNIGKTTKGASELAGEFKIMGVSLNTVTSSLKSAGRAAKASFATMKAGIASTGIGALVIAIGSLVTYFTNTKRGAESLSQGMAGLKASFDVLIDRVSMFAEGLTMMFNPMTMKKGLGMMRDAFKGIGAEIANDVKQATALEKAQQRLADSNRELNVETAQRRAEIEALKLIAEDVTKTETERLDAAKKAFQIENDLLDKRVANAEEAVRIQKEQNALGESSAADLDALAEKEISLADIRAESTTKQIELNNKINSIESEVETKRQARAQEKKDREKEEADRLAKIAEEEQLAKDEREEKLAGEAERLKALKDENFLAEIEDLQERAKERLRIEYEAQLKEIEGYENFLDLKAELDEKYNRDVKAVDKKALAWTEMTQEQKLDIASNTAGNMATIFGKESEAGKAFAITQATIDTYKSANSAYASMAQIPFVGPILGGIAAAAAVAAGLKNVQAIKSGGKGGGGGGGSPRGSAAQMPAPQMMGGEFNLAGGDDPDPVKAFVVTDEMSNSQNQLANIRRRATI